MQLNAAGIALIKHFEGCKLNAYKDQKGIPTIGWGHTGLEVVMELTWTQAQADEQLSEDLSKFSAGVAAVIATDLSDNQFSACVSLAYNIGLTAFATSHLCILLNGGDYADAALEFPKWDHCAGVVNQGLLNRREAEQALFLA